MTLTTYFLRWQSGRWFSWRQFSWRHPEICIILINDYQLCLVCKQFSAECGLSVGGAWAVSCSKCFQANIIVWGVPRHFSTLEIQSKFVDIGLVTGKVVWEGNRV